MWIWQAAEREPVLALVIAAAMLWLVWTLGRVKGGRDADKAYRDQLSHWR